jgi:hypothetical protein
MTCEYCSVDPVARCGVLTWLGHRRDLCERCAAQHGIVQYRPRRAKPPARDGPELEKRMRQT